jgi:hypothetical protein
MARDSDDQCPPEISDRSKGSLFRFVRPEAILCLPLCISKKEGSYVQVNFK